MRKPKAFNRADTMMEYEGEKEWIVISAGRITTISTSQGIASNQRVESFDPKEIVGETHV